jgi:branched-chain amino acid transport system substrate-binding protein
VRQRRTRLCRTRLCRTRLCRTHLYSGVVVALTAALAIAGCTGGQPAPDVTPTVSGVTNTQIVFGAGAPLTGSSATDSARIYPAIKAYFDYVNAKGGINGRKIIYRYFDDGDTALAAQQIVQKLVTEDKVLAILSSSGTATHAGVVDYLKVQGVPDLFVASGSRDWNRPVNYPQTFGYQVDYRTEAKILASYIAATWPSAKVCHLGRSDDMGADSLSGVELVLGSTAAHQTYPVGSRDVSGQIGALQAAGCQVVVLATTPDVTAAALTRAAAVGFKPAWLAGAAGGEYDSVAAALGAGKPLLEGLISTGNLPCTSEPSNPWNVVFKKINDEYNKDAPFDSQAIYGMSVAYLTAQLLRAAGEDLTRESLVAALQRGGFRGPGLTPLQYSNTNHAGYGGVRLTRVTAGVQGYFGPAYTTNPDTGAVVEYTDPPTAPPPDGIPPA